MLAAVGLAAVIGYEVTERTHEFGIRMALGARTENVRRLAMKHGLTPAFVGVVLGVIGALAATQLAASMLYGVAPRDPLTFVGVVALLVLVALGASWLPARRATRVDPNRRAAAGRGELTALHRRSPSPLAVAARHAVSPARTKLVAAACQLMDAVPQLTNGRRHDGATQRGFGVPTLRSRLGAHRRLPVVDPLSRRHVLRDLGLAREEPARCRRRFSR